MKKEKKYPKVCIGAFIFNDKNELLLTKGVKWHNKYVNIGGKIETGENFEETLRREVKEEANLEIEDIEFIGLLNGRDINNSYTKEDNHLIFLDYKVKAKNPDDIKINEESSGFEWLPVEEWLKKDKKKFAPYIREVLEKLKNEEEDFEGMYKRALADYQNLLKQSAQDKQNFVKYANEGLILEMIPVYDNLKLTLTHADSCGPIQNEAGFKGWVEGLKYVIKQFKNVLENMGVEEIKTKGEKFDHNTMEAVDGPSAGSAGSQQAGSGHSKGEKVVKEIKSGYKLRGKVIVPAKVIVA